MVEEKKKCEEVESSHALPFVFSSASLSLFDTAMAPAYIAKDGEIDTGKRGEQARTA
jgi:hypothetical protein